MWRCFWKVVVNFFYRSWRKNGEFLAAVQLLLCLSCMSLGFTDALKVHFLCMDAGSNLVWVIWIATLEHTGLPYLSIPLCTDTFLTVYESGVQQEGRQVTEPCASFHLHQSLSRCSHKFLFEQCWWMGCISQNQLNSKCISFIFHLHINLQVRKEK